MITEIYPGENITRYKFTKGRRVVGACKDVESPYYTWRLYVDKGNVTTFTNGQAKTEKGMLKQVEEILK